ELREMAGGTATARTERKDYVQFAGWIDDGKQLLIVEGDGRIVRLDGETLREIGRFDAFAGVFMNRFRLDLAQGRLVFAAKGQVHLWSYRDNSLRSIDVGRDIIKLTLALTRDGERIAIWSGTTKELRVVAARDGKVLFAAPFERADRLAFDAKGDRLVASADAWRPQFPEARIAVFDVAAGKPLWSETGFSLVGDGAAALPDAARTQAIVTRSADEWRDKTGQIRDLATGKVLGVLRGQEARIRDVVWGTEGWLAVAGEDTRIRLHHALDPERPRFTLRGHFGWPQLRIGTAGTRLSSYSLPFGEAKRDTAVVWNLRGSVAERHIGWDEPAVTSYQLGKGWLATGHEDGTIRFWDSPALTLRWTTKASAKYAINPLFVDPAGRYVVSDDDVAVRIRSGTTGTETHAVPKAQTQFVYAAAPHPTRPLLALILADTKDDSITATRLHLLDLDTGAMKPLPFDGAPGSAMWLAEGDRLLVEGFDIKTSMRMPGLTLFDTADGRSIATLFAGEKELPTVLAEGDDLVVALGDTVHFADPRNGASRERLPVADIDTIAHAHDRGRKLVALASRKTPLVLIDLNTRALIANLPALPREDDAFPTFGVSALRFAKDGLWVGLRSGQFCLVPLPLPAAASPLACGRAQANDASDRTSWITELAVLDATGTVAALGETSFTLWQRKTGEATEWYAGCNFCKLHPLGDGASVLRVTLSQGRYHLERWRTGPLDPAMLARARRLSAVMKGVDGGSR
ncbi:MAG: WD40 repeat domain-containing protein, partial [Rhodospirillaceae bacterium]|nr:WD40 repeat domain-containing protein [Rhodospirillaceae bacterium]